MYITADTYTSNEPFGKEDSDSCCRDEIPHLVAFGCPFLGARWSSGPMRCKQWNLAQSLIGLNLTDFYERTLAITFCVLGSDHFQLFFSLPSCQQLPRPKAWATMATAILYGSDGDPTPRGVVGFVFLQVLVCHFTMSTC